MISPDSMSMKGTLAIGRPLLADLENVAYVKPSFELVRRIIDPCFGNDIKSAA